MDAAKATGLGFNTLVGFGLVVFVVLVAVFYFVSRAKAEAKKKFGDDVSGAISKLPDGGDSGGNGGGGGDGGQ